MGRTEGKNTFDFRVTGNRKRKELMITATLSKDEELTKEDKKMLEEARKHPITFDEDSPELTPEMEKAFRLAAKTRNRLRA